MQNKYTRLLILFTLLLTCGNASALTLKIATAAPDGTTWMKELRKGADEVKQKTNGRVKFKFYPGGVMGSAKSVLRKIRIKQLHGGAFVSSQLAQVYPDIQVYGLPFIFNSYAEVDAVRSKTDAILKAGLEKNGYVALGLSEGGFAYLMCQSPMHTIDDVRGQRVWLPEGDRMANEVFIQANIKPVSLPISDVYTALQTGLIESLVSAPIATIAFQWHTRLSYLTDVPLSYLIGILAVEKKSFYRIKPDDQKIVKDVMANVFKRLDSLNRQDNINAKQALKNQGIIFTPIDGKELSRWKAIGDATTKQLLTDKLISHEIYDSVTGQLDSLRKGQ